MLVHAARPVRLECVVRGYLFGSAWKEYERAGTIGGEPAPRGLTEAAPLATPLFTATTKPDAGHDEAVTPAQARELVGADTYEQLRDLSIALYTAGAAHAQAN